MARHVAEITCGILAGLAATAIRTRQRYELFDKVVFITGGSRGLGLVLAREFVRRGARVAIAARDSEALSRAITQLPCAPDEVFSIDADMSMREEAERAVGQVRQHFGRIDVLVNNAGVITVGPWEVMTIDDYRTSLNAHFWAAYFATMAVLPEMKQRRAGRIVNISSIGGKISVPHLLPYCVGKFALTGFSEGLRAELAKDQIRVTTVCPGLMRTGSPRNALFKGKNRAEYAWFSLSDALPILSMSARRAGRQIVDACERGSAEIVLSLPAKFAVKINGIAPVAVSNVMSLVHRALPSAGGVGTEARTGAESSSPISPSWLTTLNERAAVQNNEI
jgi:NAD(P)-dependent dehydrogenase (short-subunit alcohol dehydrogenase family)